MFFNILNQYRLISTCTFVWAVFVVQTSTAQDNANYQGYRLHVFNIQVLKNNKSYYQIKFNAANTGRKDINISERKPLPLLKVDYDNSLFDNKLGSYRENIRRAMSVADLKLKVGKVVNELQLRFPKLLPEDTITNPIAQPIIPKKEVSTPSQEEEMSSNKNKNPSESDDRTPVFTDKNTDCFDFEIDTVKIIDNNKKWLTLEYTLHNKGSTSAPMLGRTSDRNDNLSIRAFISGVPKMSKGALVFGSTFIDNMPKGEDGKIPAGKRYTATFRVDIREKSRYMNYMILSLDPLQTVQECDERNNIYIVDLTQL